MHWILTVPDSFILTQVIQRSQWLLQPPFRLNRAQENLHRVERLASGYTVALAISQVPAGLVLETDERLGSNDREEISHKTWRMLRLGDNLRPFLEIANRTPGLESTIRYGAHLLRGTTFFEDVVKAIIFTMESKAKQGLHLAWIVDRFGDPLPSNPTRHAFPTPRQLIRGEQLLGEMFDPAIATRLITVADKFEEQAPYIAAMTSDDVPLEKLTYNLEQLFELDVTTIGLVMLNLSRYDYIPVDSSARRRVSSHFRGRKIGSSEIRLMFEPLQPWGGLAYWLWDWSTAHPLNSALEAPYGKLENQCRTGC